MLGMNNKIMTCISRSFSKTLHEKITALVRTLRNLIYKIIPDEPIKSLRSLLKIVTGNHAVKIATVATRNHGTLTQFSAFPLWYFFRPHFCLGEKIQCGQSHSL